LSPAAIMSAYAQTFSPERLPPDRQDSRRWNVPGFAVPGEAARSDTRSVPREAARLDNRSATVARAVGRDHNVAPLEAEFLGHGRPKRVERSVRYAGERPSALSFIFQFRPPVFRFHGSVLPCILIEVCISVGLSFAALYYTPDETFTTGMHGVVGMLLAFLIGIRTQIAWGEYSAGAGHVGGIICAARGITAEALGALIVSRETRQAGSLLSELPGCCMGIPGLGTAAWSRGACNSLGQRRQFELQSESATTAFCETESRDCIHWQEGRWAISGSHVLILSFLRAPPRQIKFCA